MTIAVRSASLLVLAFVVMACGSPEPALAGEAKAPAERAVLDSPGRGGLAGFVATPQTDAGGNSTFLLAPNSTWFLATSPNAAAIRLIDVNNGITLRYLSKPGLRVTALSISPDSKTVSARDVDGQIASWDAETGQAVTPASPADFHEIMGLRLSLQPDLIARYHLQSHFGDLKQYVDIAFNPTQEYALIGYIGAPRWNAFQIWNLKKEQTELFFRLDEDICGYQPFSFDYDGKHLIFGNTQGESFSNHLDFAAFSIDGSGPTFAPGSAYVSRTLVKKCRFPAKFDFGFQQQFDISPGAQLITRGQGMPGTPEWAAWDLRNGRAIASIHPDGDGVVSSDGSTIVVVHNPKGFDAQSTRITVQRYERRKTFNIPRSLQSDGLQVGVSPNGRWIALHLAETIVVWSVKDGKVTKKYRVSHDHPAVVLQITDKGDVLLVDERDGDIFADGRWRAVRTVEHSLIVPLTPYFHAQCGVIFCDRVVADLGVVERRPRDARARDVARADVSPDGRYMIVHTRDKGDNLTHDVIDIADGHIVLPGKTGNFVSNGRSLIVREDDSDRVSFVKYDLPTGKPVWTATPNRAEDGFYMLFPDGRVRFSPGAHYGDLVLVRGFEVRHFGVEETKQFVAPPDAVRD